MPPRRGAEMTDTRATTGAIHPQHHLLTATQPTNPHRAATTNPQQPRLQADSPTASPLLTPPAPSEMTQRGFDPVPLVSVFARRCTGYQESAQPPWSPRR